MQRIISSSKNFLITTGFLFLSFHPQVEAQDNAVYIDNLNSLRVMVDGDWNSTPVIPLNGRNHITICFDDMQHNFVRYTYTITHCNSDWQPSDLAESEYKTGFTQNRIDHYEQSMNTEMQYNHYSLRLPNEDVRLLVSGNYRVDIFQDGDDEPVAQACFALLEQKVGVDVQVDGNTDIDTYAQHQQVSFTINYSSFATSHPEQEFIPVVVQNQRWDNVATDLKPTAISSTRLSYSHNRKLIFEAGNEYRRFEILDDYVPTMHVDRMDYANGYYNATLMTDEQRKNYLFDKDQNGKYVVRNGENIDNETESDYYYTHFTLSMPRIAGGEVYLHGQLTNNQLMDDYRMEYNPIDHAYQLVIPLKQGSYNYQYAFVRDGSTRISLAETEGNFHQTENEYTIYVYHRPFGGRYDRLVGLGRNK